MSVSYMFLRGVLYNAVPIWMVSLPLPQSCLLDKLSDYHYSEFCKGRGKYNILLGEDSKYYPFFTYPL
jgi:hypothetical protein